jgi:hypothetical protein
VGNHKCRSSCGIHIPDRLNYITRIKEVVVEVCEGMSGVVDEMSFRLH